MKTEEQKFKVHYRGSLFWLIFWLIILFPVAIVLFFTNVGIQTNQTIYDLYYPGSRFWLCFWFILFFPVAIVLLCINGFQITKKPVNSSSYAQVTEIEIEGTKVD